MPPSFGNREQGQGGFAQLFREASVVLVELLYFFLDRIALGFWAALLGR